MKITLDYVNPERRNDGIDFRVSGSGGDSKQPVDYVFFSFNISIATARKIGLRIAALTGGKFLIEKEKP